jgi:DEAD/DEAH box helicase domain-containing protein
MSIGYFDIETQYLFAEVGGRSGLEKLRLSIAGLIIDDEPCRFFEEEDASELLEVLSGLDLIVGHNLLRFDYPVLTPYDDDRRLAKLVPKTLDTWAYIYSRTGEMVSLNNLAGNNVGFTKSGYGGDMPRLWREGKKDEVKEYNRHDVELTKGVYLHGAQKGYVWYTSKRKAEEDPADSRVKLEVDW